MPIAKAAKYGKKTTLLNAEVWHSYNTRKSIFLLSLSLSTGKWRSRHGRELA
jgi:hypothetical protein